MVILLNGDRVFNGIFILSVFNLIKIFKNIYLVSYKRFITYSDSILSKISQFILL